MIENLCVYMKLKEVPQEARKAITGGRLKGFTDINPMWRIKKLTEEFGICGFGWKYLIKEQRLEPGANGEISAFVTIDLFVKINDVWSEAIPGVGGSPFVAKESSGLRTSDECFKMALTDAISVASKALGMGADVYYEKDRTKYTHIPEEKKQSLKNSPLEAEKKMRIAIVNHVKKSIGISESTKLADLEPETRQNFDNKMEELFLIVNISTVKGEDLKMAYDQLKEYNG